MCQPDPRFLDLLRIPAFRKALVKIVDAEALFFIATGAILPFSVTAIKRRRDLRQFLAQLRLLRRGQGQGQLQQQKLALQLRRQVERFEALAFVDQFGRAGDDSFVLVRREQLRVVGDIGFLDPSGAALQSTHLQEFGFRAIHKGLRFGDGRSRSGSHQRRHREQRKNGQFR